MRPGHDRAAPLDAEDVFNGHQERLVLGARRLRDVVVDGLHELPDARVLGRVGVVRGGLERLQRGAADDRHVVAGVLVGGEQFLHLQLDELEQLLVVHHVDLVEEDHHRRHFDLARQQQVLARLRHGAVGGGDHEDRAVHLCCAGDHVLDVVGVPGAVDVCVVTGLGLVLDVRDRDRDPARLLFGRVVDRVELPELRFTAQRQHLRHRRRERRLAVVDVTNRPDVGVRLRPLELPSRHLPLPSPPRTLWGLRITCVLACPTVHPRPRGRCGPAPLRSGRTPSNTSRGPS